jgi:uncharacterized MAPEG superfamily protein
MTVPLWCLLAYVSWTLAILTFGVFISRVMAVRRRQIRVSELRSEQPQLDAGYQRRHRAHLNALETLPLFATVVLVAQLASVRSAPFDVACVVLVCARVVQSLAHMISHSGPAVPVRVVAFMIQPACLVAMMALIVRHAL